MLPNCQFAWDEPEGCTTPRGWLTLENHPEADNESVHRCVGNYLTYTQDHGPNGETVHAVAYINRGVGCAPRTHSLGYCWFHTVAEAKEFIEGNLRAYFGLARAA